MRVLISGASISGPVLAYWLTRYGFEVTIVERAPALRKTGGHAVDLFRPAMEISEKMGVLPKIEALATGTDVLTLYRKGRSGRLVSISPRSPAPYPTATWRSCETISARPTTTPAAITSSTCSAIRSRQSPPTVR
jgi:2-polyprenyl-6-methoxyphenol hydroxylase-like FAD-dependent oxidoreductase